MPFHKESMKKIGSKSLVKAFAIALIGFSPLAFLGQSKDEAASLAQHSPFTASLRREITEPARPQSNCASLENEIKGLEAERASLQKELQKAGPGEKPALVSQIKEINGQIQQKQRQLDQCWQAGESKCVETNEPAGSNDDTPICEGDQCVKLSQIVKNIHSQLNGHVVGYSFFVGSYPANRSGSGRMIAMPQEQITQVGKTGNLPKLVTASGKFGACGYARTNADGTPRDFRPKTKITVASVSKMVTAIAAVRILDKNNVSLDAKIGPYLPADWSVSNYVKNIKFAELLSHSAGIEDYGNVPPNDYQTLKNFFSQPVNKNSTTTCQPSSVVQPANAINPNVNQPNTRPCYSNYNFAIFRVLLPKVAGLPEDPNPATRPQTFANQYVKLVEENEFDLVGQNGVACSPPPNSSSYAFAYNYSGTQPGQDWGDVSLICGAAGWYLSAEDIAHVLQSISAKDGRILSATAAKDEFETMRTRRLGWDIDSNTELEKNGGWGTGAGSVSTSIAVFGPVSGPRIIGLLFINSNISGGSSSGKGADTVLYNAYNSALTPK
jgi:CubicO group peptidase (beta-lactamase class C family)